MNIVFVLLALPFLIIYLVVVKLLRLLKLLSRPGHQAPQWTSVPPRQEDVAGQASAAPRQIGASRDVGERGGYRVVRMLLPDGVTLNDVASIRESEEERLTVGLQCGYAGAESLLVYERDAGCLYTFHQYGEREELEAAFGRMDSDARQMAKELRAAFPRAASAVMLHKVLGLLVDPAIPAPPRRLARRLRNGSQLEARLLLPPDLRGAPDPEAMLKLAPYQLLLDGQDTGLHGPGFDTLMESPNGACLLVEGMVLNRDHAVARTWYLRRDGRWRAALRQTAPRGPGRRTYYLQPQAVGDDGRIQFRLQAEFAFDDTFRAAADVPLPLKVKLRVNWQRLELTLRPENGIVTLQLPEAWQR